MDTNTHAFILLILGILSGGPAVNLVGQLLKKVLRHFGVDSDAVIHTMVIALSQVINVLQYALVFRDYFPPQVMAVSGTGIYGWSQAIFKYAKYTDVYLEKVYVAQHEANNQNDVPATSLVPTVQNTNSSLL